MATTQGHASRRGKSGTHKYGRNAKACDRYKLEGRREKNKSRRLAQREKKLERNRNRRLDHGEDQKGKGG